MTDITHLGHAGFIVSHRNIRILVDPWFYPAFLCSWFPYPNNRFLLPNVERGRFDYLYISHCHEDHFDHRFLASFDKGVKVLCPAYRSKSLARKLRSLGFENLLPLEHKQSVQLAEGFVATAILDTSHKEDSGLQLDMDGFRFLDLNDCNPPLSELPSDVDLLAAQFSGAMWYPNCYDYPPAVMQQKVASVRSNLMSTLAAKCRATSAKAYLPSAGPACFLDPELQQFNDRDTTIFPAWENVEAEFAASNSQVQVIGTLPGDSLQVAGSALTLHVYGRERPSTDIQEYAAERAEEWREWHSTPVADIPTEDVPKYFSTLQKRNRHLLREFSKTIRVSVDQQEWTIRLGELAQDYVIDAEEPFDPDYALVLPTRVLREILNGATGWEEALLSMRVRLKRNPDVFDSRLLGLLRYGNEPVQTLKMTRELNCEETIDRDGVRFQRFCPHAGEDLQFATICNGIIECPRHHWRWDAVTGQCLEGGSLPLRVEPAESSGDDQGLPAQESAKS